jgi:hypothetical protein
MVATGPGGEPSIGGVGSRIMGAVKTALDIDSSALNAITKDMRTLKQVIKETKKEIELLQKAASGAQGSMAGMAGSGSQTGAAGTPMVNMSTGSNRGNRTRRMMNAAMEDIAEGEEGGAIGGTKMQLMRAAGTKMAAQGGTMGRIGMAMGVGGTAGAVAGGAVAAVAAYNMVANASAARMDRSREYALQADKMSVLYQQMTGKSMLGVSSTYRMPLTQYRLGEGGINALMSMEASTGISGRMQASSVEAVRTLSGYTLSASDVVGQIGSLASAPVANRMFMMGGIGMIGAGGKQRTLMEVMQSVVKSANLTDEKTLNSAFAPGSVTRSKLRLMGVPEDMQTQILQYARANLEYRKKGGSGMYNPSRESDRRRMGIEENFATQAEETQRLETKREETFYRRQADNYAYLERQTQSLTRAFGALEDSLSGIIGFTGSNRIASTITNGIMAGGDPQITGGSTPKAVVSSKSSTQPDARKDARTYVPLGDTGKLVSLANIQQRSDFKGLNPKVKDRVLNLMRDNPDIGWGGGTRDSRYQEQMFTSRYDRTSEPTGANGKPNWYWNGSYWRLKPGNNPAAPPGMSMHEIGLAVDLAGNIKKVPKVAAKYGLKHFGDKNGEPWHVQPSELPDGRKGYENSGSPWGKAPAGTSEPQITAAGAPAPSTSSSSGNTPTNRSAYNTSYLKYTPTEHSSPTSSSPSDKTSFSGAGTSISSKLSYTPISGRIRTGDPEITTPMTSPTSGYTPSMATTPQAGSSIQGNQHNLTFNINPVFNVTTNNPNFDLKKTAGELVKIVKRELEAEAMRRY